MGRMFESIFTKRATIVLILALCLTLRLGYAWHHRAFVETADAANYLSIAHNIESGNGFVWHNSYCKPGEVKPTAYGNPVYPFLLSIIFRIFGPHTFIVYVFQALLDTLTCFLVFKIARKLVPAAAAAGMAALAYAVYPPLILSVGTALTECATAFLMVSALYLLVKAFKGSMGQFALAGLLMGVLMLLKPAMLMFPVFVVLVTFLLRKQTPNWFGRALVYVVLSYAVVVPWTVRNYVVLHAFVPVASHGGATLWGGTGAADGYPALDLSTPYYTAGMDRPKDPRAVLLSQGAYDRIMRLKAQLRTADEVKANQAYTAAAEEEIRQNPGRFAYLGVKKVFRLWFNLWYDTPASKSSMALALVNALLIALAVFGSIRSGVDKIFVSVTLWLAIYTTLVSVIAMAVVRYTAPVFPLILVLSAAGVCSLLGIEATKKPDAAQGATAQ